MLNRAKLFSELEQLADSLFVDNSQLSQDIKGWWDAILSDPTFLYKVRELSDAPWPVPLWTDDLKQTIQIKPEQRNYIAASVDGSQIYPDRHQQVACFLVNIGKVIVRYGVSGKPVIFDSIPYVFNGNQDGDSYDLSTDMVNCKRQELELHGGLQLGRVLQKEHPKEPMLMLFDGSLIFWHLSSKEIELRDQFLQKYLALLFQYYQERIPMVGYISLPKSKELINLIRLYLCNFDTGKTELFAPVDRAIDTMIMHHHLKSFERSIIFQNRSAITEHYPDVLKPHFFYLHVGDEIGRVEIPAWIAQDEILVNEIAGMVLDQCNKGHGYPVVIAEAHEQAVVKGPDREFFYHALQKIGREHSSFRPTISRKSLLKRGMGI